MRWFNQGGPFAPICDDVPQAPIPVGAACEGCGEPIAEADAGFLIPLIGATTIVEKPWHEECQLRAIVGGVNHQRGDCTCCGGTQPPDPPAMSRREAAFAAVIWFGQHRRTFQ